MRTFLPILLAVLFVTNALGQKVVVDQSFNSVDNGHGKLNLNAGLGDDKIEQVIVQPDGKILISGFFFFINDTIRTYITRLNPDGSLDKTFKPYGLDDDFGDGINVLRLLPNGKILLGTIAYSAEFLNNNKHLLLLNPNGTVDSSFTQPDKNIMPYDLYDMAVQPDGKILIAGSSSDYDPAIGNALLLLNADGTVDQTFHLPIAQPGATSFRSSVHSIALAPDGKIFIGGSFVLAGDNTQTLRHIVKLNADGSLSNDFSTDNVVSSDIYKLTLQKDGRLLYASNNVLVNDVPVNNLGRLNANGTADATFNIGAGPDRFVKTINELASGKILIGGNFSFFNYYYAKGIAQLNPDGTLDQSFSAGAGISFNRPELPCIRAVAIDKNSNYVLAGYFNVFNRTGAGGIVKIYPNGAVNHSFNPVVKKTGAEDAVYDIVKVKNNKVIIAGDFITYNGAPRYKIARLNANGTLDKSFIMPAGGVTIGNDSNAYIHKLLVQGDGKLLIGGNFNILNGTNHNLIARLNANGSVDESMISNLDNFGYGIYGELSAMALQKDGKIIVGIRRDYYNTSLRDSTTVYRLNTNGSIDRSFKVNQSFNDYNSPNSIAVQSDGKIILGGRLFIIDGNIYYNNLVRLNTDGSIDANFNNTGTNHRGTDGDVEQIRLLSNGELLIAGQFSKYNNINVPSLIRIKRNGALDVTFTAPLSVYNNISSISTCFTVDSAGNIYTGNLEYSTDSAALTSPVYKLNSNGKQDSTYDTGFGANSWIYSMTFSTDNKLLIGGAFTTFNGTGKNHIAKLTVATSGNHSRLVASSKFLATLLNTVSIEVSPNPTKENVWLHIKSATAEKVTIKVINAEGLQLAIIPMNIPAGSLTKLVAMRQYSAGVYYIMIENSKMNQTLKVVKE